MGMNVELSERARRRVEQLVEEGAYPSAEAVVEAAVEQLEQPDFAGIDVEELERQARATRASGTYRSADDEYIADVKTRARSIVDSKRRR